MAGVDGGVVRRGPLFRTSRLGVQSELTSSTSSSSTSATRVIGVIAAAASGLGLEYAMAHSANDAAVNAPM